MISHVVAKEVAAQVPGMVLGRNLLAEKTVQDTRDKTVQIKATVTNINADIAPSIFRVSSVQVLIRGYEADEAFDLGEQIAQVIEGMGGYYPYPGGAYRIMSLYRLNGPVEVGWGVTSLNFEVHYTFQADS